MLIELKSVNYFVDDKTLMSYPTFSEGIEYESIHLTKHVRSWFMMLSEEDATKVKGMLSDTLYKDFVQRKDNL